MKTRSCVAIAWSSHERTPRNASLPESNARRQQVLLPGMRPNGVAEPSLVVASLEPVAARVLGVGPPDGQLGRRLELVVDDRALA
jgi:hypothetical protein